MFAGVNMFLVRLRLILARTVMHLYWLFFISDGFRYICEASCPDEHIKMAANMKIVEIWQVCTAINISRRRYHMVPFRSDNFFFLYLPFGFVGLNQKDRLTFSKLKFESDPFRVSRCVVGLRMSLMSCCWLDANLMFMKVGLINQKEII